MFNSFILQIAIKKPLHLAWERLVETKPYIENTIKVQANATNYSTLARVITICSQCEGFHNIIDFYYFKNNCTSSIRHHTWPVGHSVLSQPCVLSKFLMEFSSFYSLNDWQKHPILSYSISLGLEQMQVPKVCN